MTQTSGGQPYQSFTYDGHDKLLSGNNNGEVYGYDANGNQTGLSYYGSSYAFTFDDEDRLTNVTGPNGLNDTFAYNGLGQRVAKTDSTGAYALVSDGASPAADVLADGSAVYTPGLSSRKGSSSEFRHGDLLGSLRFLTDANQNVVANRLFSAFGSTVASSGDPSTPFGWVGDGESQTDADTGLVLMGHRLYDSRIGRFLSQDPAGDGDNWYAYADNDPVNGADPEGLAPMPGVWSINGGATGDSAGVYDLMGGGGPWGGASGHYMRQCYGGTTVGNVTTFQYYDRWVPDDPGLFDGVGGAFGVGFSAVGSALTMHLWNGGAARHDPSFGVSRGLADVGVAAAMGAAGAVGAAGRTAGEGEQLVTHWDTEEKIKEITINGSEYKLWVMKGGKTAYNYEMSGVRQLGYNSEHAISEMVPNSHLRWPGFQDGFMEGVFGPIKAALGQRVYIP